MFRGILFNYPRGKIWIVPSLARRPYNFIRSNAAFYTSILDYGSNLEYICIAQLLWRLDIVDSLSRQAERLYTVFAELVRGYQFRDREGICCHGLSVSQCHALDALATKGQMTMGELAAHLYLDTSTVTRLVDFLVANKLVTRVSNVNDRRVCCAKNTRKGQSLVSKIRAELIDEHKHVLREIPPDSREAVISAMSHLLAAFNERQQRPCGNVESKDPTACTAG
jgi:MarR family 2-MHQ and catechol resistance regulon transcriptional repressor